MTTEASDAAEPLNPTAASLLGFLHGGALSGYELAQAAEVFTGRFWSLTRSQVYRELAALADRGLVVEGETGARSRRPFALTDSGRDAFQAWLHQMPAEETIRYPLLLTMAFGSCLGPDVILDFVAEHRRHHEQRLEDYHALGLAITDPFQRALLSFATHYERAVLAWMDEVPGIIS
jgi:DNA-binding PadR family transcriptional regulator